MVGCGPVVGNCWCRFWFVDGSTVCAMVGSGPVFGNCWCSVWFVDGSTGFASGGGLLVIGWFWVARYGFVDGSTARVRAVVVVLFVCGGCSVLCVDVSTCCIAFAWSVLVFEYRVLFVCVWNGCSLG
jgi:hypothetical protein